MGDLDIAEETREVTFRAGPKAILQLCSNGDILVKGKKVTNDIEVVDGLREFLRTAKKSNIQLAMKGQVCRMKDTANYVHFDVYDSDNNVYLTEALEQLVEMDVQVVVSGKPIKPEPPQDQTIPEGSDGR